MLNKEDILPLGFCEKLCWLTVVLLFLIMAMDACPPMGVEQSFLIYISFWILSATTMRFLPANRRWVYFLLIPCLVFAWRYAWWIPFNFEEFIAIVKDFTTSWYRFWARAGDRLYNLMGRVIIWCGIVFSLRVIVLLFHLPDIIRQHKQNKAVV